MTQGRFNQDDFQSTKPANASSTERENDGKNDDASGFGKVKESAKHVGEQVKERTMAAGRQVGRRTERMVDERRQEVASKVERVAAQLRETSGRLDDEGAGVAGWAAEAAADQLGEVSAYLSQCDLDDIRRSAARTARQHPYLFLAGAFAGGLLAGRFLKSSADRPHPRDEAASLQMRHAPASRYPQAPSYTGARTAHSSAPVTGGLDHSAGGEWSRSTGGVG